MNRHFEIADELHQPDVQSRRTATPFVPCGAKDEYRECEADLAELRMVRGYRDSTPAGN